MQLQDYARTMVQHLVHLDPLEHLEHLKPQVVALRSELLTTLAQRSSRTAQRVQRNSDSLVEELLNRREDYWRYSDVEDHSGYRGFQQVKVYELCASDCLNFTVMSLRRATGHATLPQNPERGHCASSRKHSF